MAYQLQLYHRYEFEYFAMLDGANGVVRPCRSATLMTTFPDGCQPRFSSGIHTYLTRKKPVRRIYLSIYLGC